MSFGLTYIYIIIIIHFIEGKSIIKNLIEYIGYLFLFLKEEFPKQYNINILKTPKV